MPLCFVHVSENTEPGAHRPSRVELSRVESRLFPPLCPIWPWRKRGQITPNLRLNPLHLSAPFTKKPSHPPNLHPDRRAVITCTQQRLAPPPNPLFTAISANLRQRRPQRECRVGRDRRHGNLDNTQLRPYRAEAIQPCC